MSLRITQNMMFTSFNQRMNKNLSDLMESHMQSSSEKRINRPSDDPMGTARVMQYRNDLAANANYVSNVEDAMGWLSMADSTLTGPGSVNEVLSRIFTLAEQGATGTLGNDQREQISYELRQEFMLLLSRANVEYNGKSIFAGQKTSESAFEMGIGVTCTDESLYGQYSPLAQGDTSKTVLIQALTDGPAAGATFRYSQDGGATWQNADVSSMPQLPPPPPYHEPYPPNAVRINAGGASLIISGDAYVSAVDTEDSSSNGNGTWLYLRPTAVYKGDDNDNQVVTPYGFTPVDLAPYVVGTASPAGTLSSPYEPYNRSVNVRIDGIIDGDPGLSPPRPDTVQYSYTTNGSDWIKGTVPDTGGPLELRIPGGVLNLAGRPEPGAQYAVHPAAEGIFSRDVAVRVDSVAGGVVKYSYSTDDGSNWIQVGMDVSGSSAPYRFSIPGGFVNLDTIPAEGQQFIVHPHRADINVDVSVSDSVTVNFVGKEIFGGVYQDPASGKYFETKGVFDAVGKLIAAAETGSQQGMQEGLEEITAAMKTVLNKAAVVGGRQNRLISTHDALTMKEFQLEDGLSAVEDVDVTELMTRLAQQQTAYNSVLRSSSMIMQMSLVNFL